jgi:hypothetical protein
MSHTAFWEEGREVHEFDFSCDSCKRQYQFVGDKITEKRQGRDSIAETIAIQHGELQHALNCRCLNCGGPITNSPGTYALSCEWCKEEYRIIGGELIPKPPEPLPRKTLRQYANAVRSQ